MNEWLLETPTSSLYQLHADEDSENSFTLVVPENETP